MKRNARDVPAEARQEPVQFAQNTDEVHRMENGKRTINVAADDLTAHLCGNHARLKIVPIETLYLFCEILYVELPASNSPPLQKEFGLLYSAMTMQINVAEMRNNALQRISQYNSPLDRNA